MINRYAALFGGLGVLFAGYAVWWHHLAGDLEKGFPQALERSLPAGARISQTVAGVDGFPFRLNVQLRDVRVEWGDGDWAATPSLTGIFQPGTDNHVILQFEAPVQFSLEGAQGTLNAERALASIVGYEEGPLQIDADAMNLSLDRPGAMPMSASRAQGHLRKTLADDTLAAFALSARGITPPSAATGRLASILARYGEPQANGSVDLAIDEKDNIFHAQGRTLTPGEADSLEDMF
jgi:hypothetical protein